MSAAPIIAIRPERELLVDSEPSRDFVRLLDETEYGTSGVRYRARGMRKTLARLAGHTHCVELREHGELAGTYLVVERTARGVHGPIKAMYRTCLSVARESQGRGLGSELMMAVRERFLGAGAGRAVLYGTIDPTNTRSLRLAERAGYQSLATLKVVTFTRLLPYRSANVSPLRPEERGAMVQALRRTMGHQTLFDADQSVRADEVLTYRLDGRIVAAAQFVPKEVEVTSLGGRHGENAVRVAKHVPVVGDFARPTTILQTCALWAEEEHRSRLIPLLEHAMREHRAQALVMMLDERAPLHAWFLRAMRLGWLQFWTPTTETVRIMAGFRGVSEAEVDELRARPFWVSALDLE